MEDNSNIIQQLNIAVGAIVDKRSFNENASVINKWLSEITKRRTIPIGWENSQKVISQLKEIVSLSEKLPNAKGRNAKIVSANSDFNVSELKKYIQVLQEAQVAGLPTRSRRLFTQMRRLAGDYKHYQKQYGCVLHCKDTKLKAIHNNVQLMRHLYKLCFTLQRYKIESNSQLEWVKEELNASCVLHCKDTKLKAIHNIILDLHNFRCVVFYTAKIQN